MVELIPVVYMVKSEFDAGIRCTWPAVEIVRTRGFYEGERWAVRRGRSCLSVSGEFDYEPQPSSRDDEFYGKYRFKTMEDAVSAYEKYLEQEARNG